MEWDHLRTFEAVARLGSLTAAARVLGLSQSTVSRQLSALEADADSAVLVRTTRQIRLTERGRSLLEAVKPMVDAALAARAALDHTARLRGEVTLATVGELARWILVESLGEFHARYPELRMRILADNRVTSLASGDADVALRLTRPTRGELVARQVHREVYGYFAAGDLELSPRSPWLGLAGTLARIPEQRYAERAFARPARLLVEDLEALGRAVECGLGVALLPRLLARRLRGVVAVSAASVGAPPEPALTRGFWVVVHRSKQRLPKVRAVLGWLDGIAALGARSDSSA